MTAVFAKIIRRSLLLLLLLILTLTVLGTIFFSQLDLDNYRHELEHELSRALEQPVHIGSSKLTFEKGIALRFNRVQIGPEDRRLVDVEELTATLQIAPLLERRIILDQVHIVSPKLQLWLPMPDHPKRGTAHQLTDKLGIRILSISNAELKVHWRTGTTSRELFTLSHMFTVLHGWQPGQTPNLTVAGQLQQTGQPAEFLLDFNLPSSPNPEIWRQEDLSYRLQLKNFAIPDWRPHAPQRKIKVDLHAAIRGIPAQNSRITASLTNRATQQTYFDLNGNWKSSADKDEISSLSGDLLGVPLQGECYLLRQQQQQYLGGRFGAKNLDLTPELLARWGVPHADDFIEGRLENLALVVEKSWPAGEKLEGLPRIGAELTVTDFEWAGSDFQRIDDFSAELSLENKQLTIRNGILVSNAQPLFFSGRIDQLFKTPQLDLSIDMHARLEELLSQRQVPADWQLSGPLPAHLQLSGPLQRPTFSLRANLSDSEISLGSLLRKTAGQQGQLQLDGLLEPGRLQLDQMQLQLADLTLTGNGYVEHAPDSEDVLLDIDPINLQQLQPFSPLLKKLQLQGTLHPSLEQSEDGLQGELQLTDVSAQLTKLVGKLHHGSGRIELDRHGLQFNKLHAVLGQSDFLLSGDIDNWRQPQLKLRFSSPKARARDLIFRNQQLTLYDLAGGLKIDAAGITFDQIKVRLEKETEAIVNGDLKNYHNPQLALDITAEKANVDQVIQLFIGPRKLPPQPPRPDSKPLLINASVKQGSIGNLQFQNANGLIKSTHHVLTIQPLRFDSGQGSCLARVEFDHNRQDGLLKVSGHATGIDATILHQDLFKNRGLINGALYGDFYLEGSLAGEGFWPNATGAIHLQVKKGVLRKFSSLAKVFSLLNVSQLFAGKLPDMNNEGMPFTLLEGSIAIANGRAATNDLHILSESMNMSLVGSQSLIDGTLDYQMGVMPLRTVDKVISSIPVAGWVLAGEKKALLTAHFKIEGPSESPTVTAVPISTVSDTVVGILKRTVGLPGKLIKDIGSLFKGKPKKKEEQTAP